MNGINNNLNFCANSPEIRKRMQSQESFSALDAQKIKQDTADFAKNQTEEVKKENFLFRTMRNLGVDDPKKLLKSIGLTIAVTVGLAFIGNKMTNTTAKLGVDVDEFLQKQKWFNTLSKKTASVKDGIINTLRKTKTFDDLYTTFKTRMAKPKADMTRGYGRGFVSIFSLTPVDILKKTFKGKNVEEVTKALENLVGSEKAKEFAEQIVGSISDNRKFCNEFSQALRKNFNCTSNKEFLNVLEQLKKGVLKEDSSLYTNVVMKDSGIQDLLIGNWVPGVKGNLGDSLIKFNVVNGSLSDTLAGKLVQNSIIVPTESVSNFVNDKSRLGLFLCLNTIGSFNNMQDAPKGKKAATLADDFVGTMGSIAITTPLAFKSTYGLATLANTEGKTAITKLLKPIGKFFGMGLDKIAANGSVVAPKVYSNTLVNLLAQVGRKLKGVGGGAMRFALIMFVFSGIFKKPVENVVHKIFGKPYNKAEEEKAKQLEAEQNKIIPELGITQKEFDEKLKANPEAIQKLQNDPMLQRELAQNPKLIIDLLDNKEIKTKPKDKLVSPANKNFITNSRLNKVSSNSSNSANYQRSVDTATYIPSSEFRAQTIIDEQQKNEIDKLISDSDKVINRASKLLK